MKSSPALPFDLIASDYDLTLATGPSGIMGARTLDRLQKVRELGVHLAVISGRSTHGLAHCLRGNGVDLNGLYLGGFNGAHITQGWDGEVIASYTLSQEMILRVMREIAGTGVEAIVPHGADVYSAHVTPKLAKVEAALNGTRLRQLRSWEELGVAPHKVLLAGEADELVVVAAHLRQVLGETAEIAFSAPQLLEVNAQGVSKGRALRVLADHLAVDPRRTLSFGDNENDIALIKEAGIGVAMGNAIDSLKAAADRVAAPVFEDGVVGVLDEYFLPT